MGYCLVADVEGMTANRKLTYSATTVPTLVQVQAFIDEIAAEIDAVLSAKGITVPVTTNDYLKLMNKMGAAAMAEAALNVDGTNEVNSVRDWRWKKYNDMLADLKANPAMSGASVVSCGSRSDGTSNFTNENMEFEGDGSDW